MIIRGINSQVETVANKRYKFVKFYQLTF